MGINWQEKGVADRLLAAIIASHDNKLSCAEIARLYGEDATYHSIENVLRKPKRLAIQLKEEAVARQAPSSSPSKKTLKASSPKKKNNNNGVKTGRVEKKTRAKKTKAEEVVVDEEDSGESDSEQYFV